MYTKLNTNVPSKSLQDICSSSAFVASILYYGIGYLLADQITILEKKMNSFLSKKKAAKQCNADLKNNSIANRPPIGQ